MAISTRTPLKRTFFGTGLFAVPLVGLLNGGCLPTASLDETGTPGCTNCYDALVLRASIQSAVPSGSPPTWTLSLCRGEDCSESTGPVPVAGPEARVTTGDPTPPWSVVYFDVGPSSSCNVQGVCIKVEVGERPGAPFRTGDTYGVRIVSNDTGGVLYDERTPVEFTHHQCGSARSCDQADVSLPPAARSVTAPDASASR